VVKKNDDKPASSKRSGLALGIDIGGTGIKAAVSDAAGNVLGRGKVRTGADQGTKEILKRIETAAESACDDAGIRLKELELAGVAAPGAVDHRRGVVLEAVNLNWQDFPLHDAMEHRLGVPVAVENDVTAAVFAENVLGAGEDSRDLLGIWLGTGIGGGLILSGRVYHGHFLTAGEVGRGVVLPWAPPGSGTLDQICSRTGMSDTILKLLHSGRESRIAERTNDREKLGSKDLAWAYSVKDDLVFEVVEHAATVLGTAIGGMVTLLSLGRVVLGGGLSEELGEPFLETVRRATRKAAFPDRCKAVEVVAGKLGNDAGPLGAALLARQRLGDDEH
jgi:glucokinase